MAKAQAAYDALFTSEVQQCLALLFGSFMLFYMAAKPDLGGKYAEMKKRRKSQGRAREGFKWWLRRENRWWWATTILWGECFMPFMQCVLVLWLVQLFIFKGAFVSVTATAYILIGIVAFTIF